MEIIIFFTYFFCILRLRLELSVPRWMLFLLFMFLIPLTGLAWVATIKLTMHNVGI